MDTGVIQAEMLEATTEGTRDGGGWSDSSCAFKARPRLWDYE